MDSPRITTIGIEERERKARMQREERKYMQRVIETQHELERKFQQRQEGHKMEEVEPDKPQKSCNWTV